MTGGPASGKSAFAEKLAASCGYPAKYYIATMRLLDENSRERKRRHQKMRSGAGFLTFEIPLQIESAAERMHNPMQAVVLLECVANLVGNLMHDPQWEDLLCEDDADSEAAFVKAVEEKIAKLDDTVGQLIVVTSEYEIPSGDAGDGAYDAQTKRYIRLLHAVNEALQQSAGAVYTEEDYRKDMA